MWQSEKGLTMVHLVVIVIIMVIIVSIGVYLGEDLLHKDNLESIQTNMMKIEGKAILIADEHEMDETKPLIGIKINRNADGSYTVAEGDYVLSDELQKVLKEHDAKIVEEVLEGSEGTEEETGAEAEKTEGETEETPEEQQPEALYYIWTQKDLDSKGLESIKISNVKFYIVDYRGPKVFYSVGFDGIYELENLKNKET